MKNTEYVREKREGLAFDILSFLTYIICLLLQYFPSD